MRPLLSVLVVTFVLATGLSQDGNPVSQAQQRRVPIRDDVQTIDAILSALYETLGGPAGELRDWNRIRSLYFPKAAWHMPVAPNPDGDGVHIVIGSFDEYKSWTQPWFDENPFYEREVSRRVERFGHIAHAFVTFETLRNPDDEVPQKRGVNSIQLCWDEERWWILSVLWEDESADYPLPDKYLQR